MVSSLDAAAPVLCLVLSVLLLLVGRADAQRTIPNIDYVGKGYDILVRSVLVYVLCSLTLFTCNAVSRGLLRGTDLNTEVAAGPT